MNVVCRVAPEAHRWSVWADVTFDDGSVVKHFLETYLHEFEAQLAAAKLGVQLSDLIYHTAGDGEIQKILRGNHR